MKSYELAVAQEAVAYAQSQLTVYRQRVYTGSRQHDSAELARLQRELGVAQARERALRDATTPGPAGEAR